MASFATQARISSVAPASGARRTGRAQSARASGFSSKMHLANTAALQGSLNRAQARRSVLAVRAEKDGDDELPIEKSSTSFEAVLDIDAVMKILPHRFPFLLVDRVIELVPGEKCVAIKNVTINDNFFPGHFPQRPIMPGVLMVEALAQVGGIVLLPPGEEGSEDGTEQVFFFGGVDKCRFRKPVTPGDTLVLKTELVKMNKRFGIAKMKGEAYVGKDLVCEADLTLALGTES